MHHSIWKILFVLGADEYLERLEGKIRDGIFFCVNKSDSYSLIALIQSCYFILITVAIAGVQECLKTAYIIVLHVTEKLVKRFGIKHLPEASY